MPRDVFGFKDVGFEIKTESLGTLNFRRISPEYAARIEKADFQHDLPPDAFLSLLMVILGAKADGRAILVEEAYALSASERDAFVHAFLNEHGEYYRERISEERTSDLGEKVTRSYLGDRVVNPRLPGEESAAYLTRIYRDFSSGLVPPPVQKIEPPPRPLVEEHSDIFADAQNDVLLKNIALSESLGKSLAQIKKLETRGEPSEIAPAPSMAAAESASFVEPLLSAEHFDLAEPMDSIEPPAPPALPPMHLFDNPRVEVNERLNDAPPPTDAHQTLDLIRNLNSSTLQALADLEESAEKNARAARSARRIAILAFLVALILPAWPILYELWKEGTGAHDFSKIFVDRSAQAAAEQKQQIDTLKSIVEQLRAQRAQAPARVAD